jgi:hypothetical protein
MTAETKAAPAQTADAQFQVAMEQQRRLRTTLSPEEFEADRMLKVERLLRSCKELSEEAERNGLTEEILDGILAEK